MKMNYNKLAITNTVSSTFICLRLMAYIPMKLITEALLVYNEN